MGLKELTRDWIHDHPQLDGLREYGLSATRIVTTKRLAKALEGKTMLLTGASSGIGAAVARMVGEAGGKLIMVSRSADKLEEMRAEVESLGGDAYAHACDVSDPDDCKRLIEEVLEQHGHVDILVNNAGRSIRRSVEESLDRFHDYQRTIQLNYLGCVQLTLGFLPSMKERKAGLIINNLSMSVQVNPPRFSAYVASKAALEAFGSCLAAEVLHDNIVVTSVYTPLVRTPMIAPTKLYDNFKTLTPEQAAKMLLQSVLTKQRKVLPRMAILAGVISELTPKTTEALMNKAYKAMENEDTSRKAFKNSRVLKTIDKMRSFF